MKNRQTLALIACHTATETEHPLCPLFQQMFSLPSPSSLQGDIMKAQPCSVALGGKSQKRAGGRGDQSSDTTAASTKLDSSQMHLRKSYHRPLTKCGYSQRPVAYTSQSPIKTVSKNVSAFANCCQMMGLCIC